MSSTTPNSDGVAVPSSAEARPHWFWSAFRRNKDIYWRVAIAAIVTNIFALTTSIFTMTVYDRILPNDATESLVVLAIGVGLVLFFDFIIKNLRSYFVDVASTKADKRIARDLFGQILDLALKTPRGQAGALANTMREFESLREFFTSASFIAVIDFPFVILFLTVIWFIGGPIVLVPLLMVPLVLGVGLAIQPFLARLSKQIMEGGQNKHGVLIEAITGLETLKTTAFGPVMAERWGDAVDHTAEQGRESRIFSQLALATAATAQQVTQVGIVCYGVFLVKDGTMTAGALIACVILSGRTMAPLGQLANILARAHHALSAYRAIDKLMQADLDFNPTRSYLRRPKLDGKIEFRDVKFSYPGSGQKALDGVTFTVEPGEKVGILGRIGSGKSTIARLIQGLYDPDEGTILLDNTEIRQIDPRDRRANMGVVLQDVTLFSGSIRDNIAAGRQMSDEEVIEAAKASGLHDFIGGLPNGYDIRLAERGEGLSGGQKQAISISRALAGDPSLLILDEPTSAMDVRSEAHFLQRVQPFLKDHTLVLVTHRTSMLAIVDKLIVVDKGKIVAQGPKADVLAAFQRNAGAPASKQQNPQQNPQQTPGATAQLGAQQRVTAKPQISQGPTDGSDPVAD